MSHHYLIHLESSTVIINSLATYSKKIEACSFEHSYKPIIIVPFACTSDFIVCLGNWWLGTFLMIMVTHNLIVTLPVKVLNIKLRNSIFDFYHFKRDYSTFPLCSAKGKRILINTCTQKAGNEIFAAIWAHLQRIYSMIPNNL